MIKEEQECEKSKDYIFNCFKSRKVQNDLIFVYLFQVYPNLIDFYKYFCVYGRVYFFQQYNQWLLKSV